MGAHSVRSELKDTSSFAGLVGARAVCVLAAVSFVTACSAEIGSTDARSPAVDSTPEAMPTPPSPPVAVGGRDAGEAEDAGAADPDLGSRDDLGADEDLGPADAGPEPEPGSERVAVFIAQGDVGRTIMSCDDGRSWIHDRAFDREGDEDMCGEVQDVRCFNQSGLDCRILVDGECRSDCDCLHAPGAGRGIAYGDGAFVATWGWGPPGGLRVSTDGVEWTKVVDGTTFAGIRYSGGRFVTGGRQPLVASDPAAGWVEGGPANLQTNSGETIWNPRGLFELEGRLMIVAQSGDRHGLMLSDDHGASWRRPEVMPDGCGAGTVGAASGDGVIVWVGADKRVCRSTDGGRTFTASTMDAEVEASSGGFWDGQAFRFFGRGAMISSPDGVSWRESLFDAEIGPFGAVDRSPTTGTYVAVSRNWRTWYDEQQFYRSEDGVDWELLGEADFTRGHAITDITHGFVDASPDCPAPPSGS